MLRFLPQFLALFAIFFTESANASCRDLGARQPSDAVLALKSSRFLLCDESNVLVKLISPAGAVLWQAEYAPFGAALASATIDINLRLPGQYYDAETGLHYNLARYYDPSTGRYTQPDPIRADLNSYSYANANPYHYFDPSGTQIIKDLPPEEQAEIMAALFSLMPGVAGQVSAAFGAGLAIGNAAGAAGESIGEGIGDAIYEDKPYAMPSPNKKGAGYHAANVGNSVVAAIPYLGAAAAEAKLAKILRQLEKSGKLVFVNCKKGSPVCYSAGHRIITQERGLINIETLRAGEHVLTRNELNQETWGLVSETLIRRSERLCELRIKTSRGEIIHSVTPEHRKPPVIPIPLVERSG